MNIPKEAIEKAIEGGWKPKAQELVDFRDKDDVFFSKVALGIALDPLFWQALGKSLGWPTGEEPDISLFDWKMKGWSGRAHRFYDLIHTNGDTDVYWKELLKV